MAAQVGDLVFMRLANVEQIDIFSGVQLLFEIDNRYLRYSVVQCRLLWGRGQNAAKLVIVNQLLHGRMRAADRAVGVLAQLELAEVHVQRINEQQAADERVADAEDELDRLSRLNHADQAGKNAQDPTLGARRHQAGRRRLWIEAAIAGTIFRRKDARLPLKAEDRPVGVRLPRKNAGIVDQIPRLKIVSAVGDHIELADDLQRVGAGQHGV